MNIDLCLIIGIIVVCVLVSYIYIKKTKEQFAVTSNSSDTLLGEKQQAAAKSLSGETPHTNQPNINMNDYIKKTELERVARASALEYCPVSPNYNPSNYIKKTEIDLQQSCPKMPNLEDYVLKSTIPPIQKCPSCVCPKIKLDAGLCKKCPEPINNCPKPTPCTPEQCKKVIKCEPWQKQVSCPKCPAPEPCPQLPEKVCPAITLPKSNIKCPEPKPCPIAPCPNGNGICPDKKCPSCTYKKVETVVIEKTTDEIVNELINSEDPELNNLLETLKNKLNLNEAPSPTELNNLDLLTTSVGGQKTLPSSNKIVVTSREMSNNEVFEQHNGIEKQNNYFEIKQEQPKAYESGCQGDYCSYDTNLNI
jgi:hypothetical protein